MASVTHLTNQSQFVQSNAAFNGTNATGTIASNGISISVNPQTSFFFSNTNGVTFGTNGSTITASVATNYQSPGAYLTTARASNDAIGLNTALTGNGVTWTVNSSGISLSVPAFLTTAALSNHSHGNPTLALTNISGTTASNSAGLTLSLSAAAPGAGGGIAVANSQTTYTSGTAHLSVVGGAMTIASTTGQSFNFSVPATSSIVGVGGITISTNGSTISISNSAQNPTISAGTTSHAVNSLNFSNANGVTFGMGTGASSTVITASVGVGGGGGAALKGSGTYTQNTGTVEFANSNGITFGLSNNGTMTASHNGLTTARASNDAIGLNTALTANGVSVTANSSGLSLNFPAFLTTAQPVGAYLTTAALSDHSHNFATTTTNGSLIVVATTNSNGATIAVPPYLTTAQTPGAYLTTARASNDAIGLNTALTAGPLAWTVNSSGLSLNASNAAGTTSGFAGNLISGSMTHNTAGLNLSLNHPAWITTAMASNAVTLSNIRVSGGTTSNLLSAITFSDSNGISFGLNAGTMTASHNGLTTAALSNHSHGNPTLALTNLSGTTASNSAGLTLSLSAAAPGGGGGIAIANSQTTYTSGTAHLSVVGGAMTIASTTGQSFNFSVPATSSIVGVGGITISTNGSTISISNSAQNPTISAGTTSHAVNSLNFSNANGVTFGMGTGASSTVITASVNAGGGGAALKGSGTYTQNTGTIEFANSNGITFGLSNNGTMTASHNGLTTAALSNHSHNLATTTTNGSLIVVATTNSLGATFAVPPYLTTAQPVGAYLTTARASNDAIGLNTALTANGVSWTVNSSGLSLNVPAFLTTAALSNHSHGNPTLALTNLSGTTASNSAGLTLSLSAADPGGGAAVTASASNGSFTAGLLAFSNANNVTFGTSAGSIITASVAAPGAAAENNWVNLLGANTAGNTTASGSTIGYSGINLTLSGTNGSVVNISAPAVSSVIGASGISISTNGSTISVGKVLQSTYVPAMAYSTVSQTLAALGATSGSARFFPIILSDNIIFNELRVMHFLSYATSSVSGQQTISYQYGLFSNNAGSLSSISSSSFSLAVTNSSVSNTVSYPASTGTAGYTYTTLAQTTTANIQSFWGTAAAGRPFGLQFGNTMSLSSGLYWLGVNLRHSSSSANIGISVAMVGNANAQYNNIAYMGQASSAQTTNTDLRQPYQGLGAFTVSQSSLPNNVPLTQIAHTQTIHPLMTFILT